MTISKVLSVAIPLVAMVGWTAARAEDPPGSRPGDDALTCEQIYAQGSAESQREQDERNRRNDERRAQTGATMALAGAAMATGGMGGTGPAAQKAAEGLADRTMADLGTTPKPNPRKDRLRQLWTQKHCVRK